MSEKNVDWCEKLDKWKTNNHEGETSTKGQRVKKSMQMSKIW